LTGSGGADQYFAGGQQLYTGYPVTNTADPTLYRWGGKDITAISTTPFRSRTATISSR
jgi:hypothetical protein